MGDKKLEILFPMHCEGPSFTHALSWMGASGPGTEASAFLQPLHFGDL